MHPALIQSVILAGICWEVDRPKLLGNFRGVFCLGEPPPSSDVCVPVGVPLKPPPGEPLGILCEGLDGSGTLLGALARSQPSL